MYFFVLTLQLIQSQLMENSKKRTRDKGSQSSSRATENGAPSSQLSQNSNWGFSQFITGVSQTPTPQYDIKASGSSSNRISDIKMPTITDSHKAMTISASQKNKAKKNRPSQSSQTPASRPSQARTVGTPYAQSFFSMEVPSSSQFFEQSTSQAIGPERPPMSQLFPLGQETPSTPQLEQNLFDEMEDIFQGGPSQRPTEKISSTHLLKAQMWKLGGITEGNTSTWSQLTKGKVRGPSQPMDSQAWRLSQQVIDRRSMSHANPDIKNDQNVQSSSQAERTTQKLSQLSIAEGQDASQASETDGWSLSQDFEAGVWPSVSQPAGDSHSDTPPIPLTSAVYLDSDSDMDSDGTSSSRTDLDQDDSDGDDSVVSDTTVRPYLSSSQYDHWEPNESQWNFSYSQDSQRSQELGDYDESEDGYPSRLEAFMDGRCGTDEDNETQSQEMNYGTGSWLHHPSVPEWLPELEGDDEEGSFYEPLKRIRH